MTRATRYKFAASLSWGGDEPTAEMEVEVTFSVNALGVEDIDVVEIDGLPLAEALARGSGEYMAGETVRMIVDKLEMDYEAEMLEEAAEAEAAARDRADEHRAEMAREAWD